MNNEELLKFVTDYRPKGLNWAEGRAELLEENGYTVAEVLPDTLEAAKKLSPRSVDIMLLHESVEREEFETYLLSKIK